MCVMVRDGFPGVWAQVMPQVLAVFILGFPFGDVVVYVLSKVCVIFLYWEGEYESATAWEKGTVGLSSSLGHQRPGTGGVSLFSSTPNFCSFGPKR